MKVTKKVAHLQFLYKTRLIHFSDKMSFRCKHNSRIMQLLLVNREQVVYCSYSIKDQKKKKDK